MPGARPLEQPQSGRILRALLRSKVRELNQDRGDEAPVDSLNSDYWSARWERTIQLTTGTYRFTATADNGVRVWVDDTLVVDAWSSQWNQSSGLFFGDIVVDAGSHVLRVDYYDAAGPASLQLDWELYVGPPVAVEGWLAEYFNNTTLSGDPVLYHDEADIALVLQARSPQTGVVLADNFRCAGAAHSICPPASMNFPCVWMMADGCS